MKRKQDQSGKCRAMAVAVLIGAVTVLWLCWQLGGQKDDVSRETRNAGSSAADSGSASEEAGDGAGDGSSGAASTEGKDVSDSSKAGDGAGDGSSGAASAEGKDVSDSSKAGDGAGDGSSGAASTEGKDMGDGSGSLSPEQEAVEKILAEMTLEEKVYQLFVVFPSSVTGVSKVTKAGETTRRALEKYPVGGLIYDKSNMVSQEQIRTMLENVQSYTKIPLILTCDEEGGRVSRLMSTVGTTQIGPMFDYREEGKATAKQNAGTIADDLKALGFNMDLAPVADVWSNPRNTVIGDRAYSDDFQQAAELVAAAVTGFREGGVACTLKHFPGHGDTSTDSHYGAVYVYKTLDELREEELLPFQAGIDAGADAVMMGHLVIADVEEEPALFSYRLVTELLREEMHFQGVVITDSLQMRAMTDDYGGGEIVVRAVKAGVDMLLCPEDLEAAADALIQAVESGEISRERLDESVRRILTLKQERGILQ